MNSQAGSPVPAHSALLSDGPDGPSDWYIILAFISFDALQRCQAVALAAGVLDDACVGRGPVGGKKTLHILGTVDYMKTDR